MHAYFICVYNEWLKPTLKRATVHAAKFTRPTSQMRPVSYGIINKLTYFYAREFFLDIHTPTQQEH